MRAEPGSPSRLEAGSEEAWEQTASQPQETVLGDVCREVGSHTLGSERAQPREEQAASGTEL